MKDNIEQIKECRNVQGKLGYLAWHYAGKRRAAKGQSQVYCLLCQRWKWSDKLCESALLRTANTDPITQEWDNPEEDEAWKDL